MACVALCEAEIDPTDPARIALVSGFTQKDQIKALAGSGWDRERNLWTVPLSWTTCLALRGTFGAGLEIGPRLNAWALNERIERIEPAMALREKLDAAGDSDLYAHQRADVAFMVAARQVLIGNEPGTGKTASTIRAALALYRKGEQPFPILIVTPNTVKRSWRREFHRWWPGLTITVVTGTALQRRKKLATPSHVFIINWESLRAHSRLAPFGDVALARCRECGGEDESISITKCEVHKRELNEIPFNLVVADEAHRAKDARSKQTRALWAATGDAEFRYALTGTPIANDASELWPVLHWMSPTEWPTKTKWMDRNVNIMFNAFGGTVVSGIKPEREAEFFATFHPRFRRMLKAQVLKDLPPVVCERRDVEMTPKQRKAYIQMQEELLADVDGGSLMAPNVLQRTLRLLQLASSFGEIDLVPDPKKPGEYKEVFRLTDPSSKVDAFMDDLPDFAGQSVLVFAVSRQLINLLSARLTKAKIKHGLITGDQTELERDNHISAFQAGHSKLILSTIQAGGVGITLSRASVMAFLQRSWSQVDQIQAENRAQRPGAEAFSDSILKIDYVCPGSVEEAVIRSLAGKGENLESIVRDRDAIRRMLLGEEE